MRQARARLEGEGGEQGAVGDLVPPGGGADLGLGLADVGAALQQFARNGVGRRRRLARLGVRGHGAHRIDAAAHQDQQGALVGVQLRLQALGVGHRLGQVPGHPVRVRGCAEAEARPARGDVLQLALDAHRLARVVQLDGQAPDLEIAVGDIGGQGGARSFDVEQSRGQVGVGHLAGDGQTAEQVDLPGDVEVQGLADRRAAHRDQVVGVVVEVAGLLVVGVPHRLGLGQRLGDQARAGGAGLQQPRRGRARVGAQAEGVVFQGVQGRVVEQQPPMVQFDRRQGGVAPIFTGMRGVEDRGQAGVGRAGAAGGAGGKARGGHGAGDRQASRARLGRRFAMARATHPCFELNTNPQCATVVPRLTTRPPHRRIATRLQRAPTRHVATFRRHS